MSDIYQRIWDADQTGSGVRAIFADSTENPASGYVKVNQHTEAERSDAEADFKVITDVLIPPEKTKTYDLCRALFDNYALSEATREIETAEEREEVHNLLQAMVDTAPMQVARTYVEEATGTAISKERWYGVLLEMWFRSFTSGGDPDLTGFEHVVVGEQEGPKVQGYHFWYKYWLDDGLADQIEAPDKWFPALNARDRIVYLRSQAAEDQGRFPESVTISYRWNAPDYAAKAIRPLTKPKGGFFVGCSVEGLLAIGTVRAHLGARAPKEAVINGARYDLKLFRSADDKHVRTFYPVFLGSAGQAPVPMPVEPGEARGEPTPSPVIVTGPVRIVAALLNPVGADPGSETVTLVNTGPTSLSLDGWRLVDKMRNHYTLKETELRGGIAVTIVLPKDTVQLSNRGGEIRLVDRAGQTVHVVSFSKAQASREGETVVF